MLAHLKVGKSFLNSRHAFEETNMHGHCKMALYGKFYVTEREKSKINLPLIFLLGCTIKGNILIINRSFERHNHWRKVNDILWAKNTPEF